MIKPHNWVQLLYVVPEDFKHIVRVCHEYEELIKSYEVSNQITGSDISNMQILVQSIMTEYMKIVSTSVTEEKILQDIRTDMLFTLSNWFDSKGNVRNLSNDFIMSMNKNQLQFHLPLFATPSSGFTHSRIYWSMVEASKVAFEFGQNNFFVEELGKNVPEKDWIALSKQILPSLCVACKRFEDYIEHLYKVSPMYNKSLERELSSHWLKVVEEYLKIARDKDQIIKDIQSFDDAISFTNSAYYYLKSTKVKMDAAFANKFVSSTKHKAGIFPELGKDDKIKINIPPKAAT